jgi:prepilin peptidase CpaA
MSPLALLQTCCVAVLALLLVIAAWQDLRTMQIANGLSLAIVASFAVWALAGLAGGRITISQVGLSVACGAVVFCVGALAFAAGAVGGGDVKLLAAVSLFAGPSRQLDFLTITAIVGGLIGFAMLAGAPIGPSETSTAGTVRSRRRGGLPYGPAIAAGGLWVAASLALT